MDGAGQRPVEMSLGHRLGGGGVENAFHARRFQRTHQNRHHVIDMNPAQPLAAVTEPGAQAHPVHRPEPLQHAAATAQHHAGADQAQPHALPDHFAGGLLPGVAEPVAEILAPGGAVLGQLGIAGVAVKTHRRAAHHHRGRGVEPPAQRHQFAGGVQPRGHQGALAGLTPAPGKEVFTGQIDDAVDSLVVADVVQGRHHPRAVRQFRPRPRRRPAEHGQGVAVGGQPPAKLAADETTAAGYQDLHCASSIEATSPRS